MVTNNNEVDHVLSDLLDKGVTKKKKRIFLKRIGETYIYV